MLVQVTNHWQSLNSLTGVPVGSAVLIQSQSSGRVYVAQQPTAPQSLSDDAAILDFKDVWQVTKGSEETWVKVLDTSGQLYVETL